MFQVLSIHLDPLQVEGVQFEIEPTNEQGRAVCTLFTEFLKNRPPEFHDKIGFLKRGDFSLDWASAEGGVAMATISESGEPASMGVLLSGSNSDADEQMLALFHENILTPMLGDRVPVVSDAGRPALIQVLFPTGPEWLPTTQLLSAALASVYFRDLRSAAATPKR